MQDHPKDTRFKHTKALKHKTLGQGAKKIIPVISMLLDQFHSIKMVM